MVDQDYISAFAEMYNQCARYTMTSRDRMYAIFTSIQRIVDNGIPGDIVECGVWKGGSMMMAAMALRYFGDTSRKIWMYDTYEGMPEPEEMDMDLNDRMPDWKLGWLETPLEEVINNMMKTNYPHYKVNYITGRVEETIPWKVPDEIALLRLDTDWYQSTKHELLHLYPLLSPGGVLIIDDYGHWKGARRATDEYFGKIDLIEIDYTGRMLVK